MLLLTMHFFYSRAQIISGYVYDAETSEALPYANIILIDIDSTFVRAEVSDLDGNFTLDLEGIVVGYLELSSISFVSRRLNVETLSPSIRLEVALTPDQTILDEVAVTSKKPIYVQEIDRMVMNVESSAVSKGANVLELLERSPGVTVDRINRILALQGKQGVIVAMNGKRLRQDGVALFQMLEGMSANNVKNIEFISTPPASYDADGNAGVININLIKSNDMGLNGLLSASVGQGDRPKLGSALSFNYRQEKLNFYGSINIDQNYTNQDVRFQQKVAYDQELLDASMDNQRPVEFGFHTGKVGIDYDISDRLALSSFVSGSIRRWDMQARAETSYHSPFKSLEQEILTSQEKNYTDHYMLSNRLSYTLGKLGSISLDYDYLNYLSNNPTDYKLLQKSDGVFSQINFNSTKRTPNTFQVARLDYRRELSEKFDCEMGLKLTLGSVNNRTGLHYTYPEVYTDPFFAEATDLRESTYAAYASSTWKFQKDWILRSGLRFEHNGLDIESVTDGKLIDRDVPQLFPSLSISRTWDQVSTTLSYTRRVDRPSFQTLASAFYFFDTRTVYTGNINVIPTTSDNYGLQINVGAINTSINYTYSQNPLLWAQPEFMEENAQFLLFAQNSIDRKLLSSSLSFPLNFGNAFSSRFNITATHVTDRFMDGDVERVTSGANVYGNLDMNYLFPSDWSLELTANGNIAGYMGLIKFAPRLSANLAVSKKFSAGWSATLNWIDLFNHGSYFGLENRFDNPEYAYRWRYDLEGNIVRLTLSKSFGNDKAKKEGRASTSSSDIQSRATN